MTMTDREQRALEFLKGRFSACQRFKEHPADGAYRLEHSVRAGCAGKSPRRQVWTRRRLASPDCFTTRPMGWMSRQTMTGTTTAETAPESPGHF